MLLLSVLPETACYHDVIGIIMHFTGLMDGYRYAAPHDKSLEEFAFDFLSGNGDWLDIQKFIYNGNFFKKKTEHLPHGHCSVLFKVLPGYENIYASHSR